MVSFWMLPCSLPVVFASFLRLSASLEDAEGDEASAESEEPVVACPTGGVAQALQKRHGITTDPA